MPTKRAFAVTSMWILALSSQCATAGEVYRYVNDKGVQVIDDAIPPRFVPKGYDILDGKTLTLIRRVPRQLTQEEREARSTEEAKAQFKAEEAKRLREWDESLMLRYSSIDDIKAAQKRAVQDLDIRIGILKSNLTSIKGQIEREQQKAADIERRGQEVPQEVLNNIDVMRAELEDTEQSIDARRREVESVKASFKRDMERFSMLLDKVNMRRGAAAAPGNEGE